MLLSHMSLADKVAEMYINEPTTTGPDAGYEGFVSAQPALCIPALVEQDGSVGVAYGATGVTQLPAEISLASAWDPSLAYQYGVVNGAEHRAKGIAMVLGPGVNIQRDPRWGRNFEMFSEDPLLTSELGAANIEGIQSQQVMADVKHFVTYNQETNRATPNDDTIVNARALHEIYLPPFYSAIEQAHAASVMCAYPLVEWRVLVSEPWTADRASGRSVGLSGVRPLRQRGQHLDRRFRQRRARSGAWELLLGQRPARGSGCRRAGAGPRRSPQAVRRILTQMFQFDLFNNPPTGNLSSPASTPADNAFAQNVAQRGTVLLQNTGSILPLSTATTKSIAVIGPDGTTSPQTAGTGSSYVTPSSVISPLSGITSRAGSAATVTSYSGTDPTQAAATAQQAQVAIVFASYSEGEGSDLTNISLPNGQDAMIEAVAAANPNTIVVLNTGGPVLMPWLSSVKGVLEAWYPGQDDGAAIASVLFGDVDPSGHLPQTFPTSLSEIADGVAGPVPRGQRQGRLLGGPRRRLPLVRRRAHHAAVPVRLRAVVYDLQLQSAEGHARIGRQQRRPGRMLQPAKTLRLARVTARITNTGQVRGSDVAQLYVGDPAVAGEPPRQLEGFHRRHAAAAPVADRYLHDHGTRALLLQREGERMDRAQWSVLAIRRRLVRTHVASAARKAEGHEDDRRPLRRAGRAGSCQPRSDLHREGNVCEPRERADHGRHRAARLPVQLDRRPLGKDASPLTGARTQCHTVFPGDRSGGSRGRGQEPDGAALIGGNRRRRRPERDSHDLGARPDHGHRELTAHRRPRRLGSHNGRGHQPHESSRGRAPQPLTDRPG